MDAAMKMRNSELKEALRGLAVNTRGVFDKHELAQLYIDASRTSTKSTVKPKPKSEAKTTTATNANGATKKLQVDMLDIRSSNVPGAKGFIGVRLTDKRGNLLTAMIDTAASTNLITSSAVQRLNLNRQAFNQYGSGLSGQTQIASEKTTLSALTFAGVPETEIPIMDASILNNPGMLPPSVDVLLGLPFLQSLQSLITMDLVNKKMTFTLGTMDQEQQGRYHKIGMRRSYPTGLLMIDASLGTKGRVDAMVDIGSTYSILSKEAVQNVLGVSMDSLPLSPTVSAGISGAPMQMRECKLNSLLLGISIKIAEHKVYAADIPQLSAIGMNGGILLLGMDILGRHDTIAFCFQENALYLLK